LSDRPSGEGEGLRISAARAGQRPGDDWDGEPDGDVWAEDAPAAAAPTGGRGFRRNGHDDDPAEEGAGGRRRRFRPGGGRKDRSGAPPPGPPSVIVGPVTAPPHPAAPAVTPPVPLGPVRSPARPARPGLHGPSPERLKVLHKRRRRRRTLIACTFLTTVCTFVAGVGYVYVQSRLDQIKRLDLASLTGDAPGSVMNVLLVGSDTRTGLDGTGAGNGANDNVQGQVGDTIMILHVDPRRDTAAIVSVPRDLYVPIAGGAPDRVNAAFALGGADRLVRTIQGALGITVNHYVQVDFSGFKDIVDAVGGLTLFVPYAVRDTASGLAIDGTGCISVDGTQALSWARSSQTEFLVDGAWQRDPQGDLGRIQRQEDVVHRMVGKALTSGVANPIRLSRLIGVGERDVTFDSAMSTRDLSDLGRRFSSVDPQKVALRSLPTNPVQIGGKSVLTLQANQAQPTLDLLNGKASADVPTTTVPAANGLTSPTAAGGATTSTVKGTTTTTKAPTTAGSTPAGAPKASDVRIRILNGVGSPGAASKAATSLTNLGFTVADKGDAPSISPKTTIMYGTGQLAKAQLVQSSLVTPGVLKEDATLKAVDVNLVLGGDFTGIKAGIASGNSPSTTAASPFATTTVAPQNSSVPLPKGATAPPC
jgi:LCP family protein required for cell wall assembly